MAETEADNATEESQPIKQSTLGSTEELTAADIQAARSAESITRKYLAAQEQVEIFVPVSITGVTRGGKPSDIYVGYNGLGFRLLGGRKHKVPRVIAELVQKRIEAEERLARENSSNG